MELYLAYWNLEPALLYRPLIDVAWTGGRRGPGHTLKQTSVNYSHGSWGSSEDKNRYAVRKCHCTDVLWYPYSTKVVGEVLCCICKLALLYRDNTLGAFRFLVKILIPFVVGVCLAYEDRW